MAEIRLAVALGDRTEQQGARQFSGVTEMSLSLDACSLKAGKSGVHCRQIAPPVKRNSDYFRVECIVPGILAVYLKPQTKRQGLLMRGLHPSTFSSQVEGAVVPGRDLHV